MADYPHYSRRLTLRLGACGVAVLLLLLLFALGVRARRSALWDLPLPRHPAARATITRQSRLLGWRMTSYLVSVRSDDVQAYYSQAMPAEGWQARGLTALPSGAVSRWLRHGLTVEVQTVAAGEQTRVNLLVTASGPTSER